jgi:hypothetical protein
MTKAEFVRLLASYDDNLQLFACSENNLWQVNTGCLRETTLQNTEGGDMVEENEYNSQTDGKIISQHEVLLLDLDL